MNIAIRYYSKTGHMKKMADVVSTVVGMPAKTEDVPLTEPVDTLFLGSAVYMAGIDDHIKQFIDTLDSSKVKNVTCFSSTGILKSSYPR